MRERIRPLLESLASFLAPGLLLLLLGIQVAFGLRGFEHPSDSLFVIFQVPGVLLGWGGVVLLLPLLVWMILDWWGYNLGGFALRGLGSAVLGIAAGALCGVAGASSAGGIVGGGLADILLQTVGSIVAVIVLVLMALPASVLAFNTQKATPRPAPASGTPATDGEEPRFGFIAQIVGVFRRKPAKVAQKWYPQQRFDAVGNELPMDFGASRDVGGIRYAEDEVAAGEDAEAEATDALRSDSALDAPAGATSTEDRSAEEAPGAEPAPAEAASTEPATIADLLAGEERLPTIPELLSGNFNASSLRLNDDPSGGPRELASDGVVDGPVHVALPSVESQLKTAKAAALGDTLLPGVRYADEAEDEEAAAPADESASEASPEADATAVGAALTPEDEALGLSQAVHAAVRGPAASAVREGPAARRAMRDSVRESVAAIKSERENAETGTKSRYLQKLEALGMFDFALPDASEDADDDHPAQEAAPTERAAVAKKKQAATKKKAAKKKKKKKAAAKKKAARAKASPKKQVTKKAAKKKTAARKKSAATRPAAAKPAAGGKTTKPARQATRRSGVATKSAAAKPARKKATKKRAPRKAPPGPEASLRSQASLRTAKLRAAMLQALRIERLDPLYSRAVEAALERQSASAVFFTRRLGLPFARATSLLERMVATGVLGPAGASGANPVLITRAEWTSLSD